MTQTLQQLSAAATRGEWREAGGDAILAGRNNDLIVVGSLTASDYDPLFIVALVNAYRTGQLVEVQADDATVERVASAIGTSLAYDIEMDVRAGSLTDDEKRKVARKAIAAMKGPKL